VHLPLYLSQGEPSVIVETDDNLNQNIETLVEDGVFDRLIHQV
jgi:hypothetical protein